MCMVIIILHPKLLKAIKSTTEDDDTSWLLRYQIESTVKRNRTPGGYTSGGYSNPKTGDDTPIAAFLVMALMALGSIAAILAIRKKRRVS